MAQTNVFLLMLAIQCMDADIQPNHGIRTEVEALRYLFSDPWRRYDAPFNANGTAVVQHMLTLNRIVSLDLEKQILTLDAWVTTQYTDEDMSWNPSLFSDLKTIRIPVGKAWKPDIMLYNSAKKADYRNAEVMSILTYDGTVMNIQPVQFQSYCRTERAYRTGDTVECSLKFGSWTYDGFKLDLELLHGTSSADVNNFDDDFNRDWKLTSNNARRNVQFYECCPEPYIDLVYTFKFTKK